LKLVRLFECVLYSSKTSLSGVVEHRAADDLFLEMFADANLAGSEKSARSTSGGITFVTSKDGRSRFPLAWSSSRQTSTSTSTAESEIVSLSKATQSQLLPLEHLWDQLLQRPVRSVGREDNSAALAVIRSGFSTALRFLPKHQRVCVGLLSETWSAPHRSLTHATSAEQRADGLTKLLSPLQMVKVYNLLGVTEAGAPLDDEYFSMCKGSRLLVVTEDDTT